MLFNSYEFLFAFLPLVLFGYYVLFAKRGRMVFLTLMSYVFYGWWDYRFCALMLISTLIDYAAGIGITSARTPRGRRGWLLMSILSNLSLLGFFKYFDLAAATVNWVAGRAGGSAVLPLLHVTLPVGISFYTFQSMSYSIDLYWGHAKPARGFWDFACYVALFPQLVAGPIVRYHELADQLVTRTHTIEKAAKGIALFILGLAKKVIVADGVAVLVGEVFGKDGVGLLGSWVGILSYAMQIYFDFSGYSDMAIGLGLLLGFQFPQNFDSPYKAVSITDFWRRWHISLSGWLRDYLYIPLGGNRLGLLRTYVNLFLTMLLGGLWHGASWTFMLWGGFHGVLLAVERGIGKRGIFWWAPAPIQRAGTFLLVLAGWVLFRCTTLREAGRMFSGLAGLNGWGGRFVDVLGAHPQSVLILSLALLLTWGARNTNEMELKPGMINAIVLGLLLVFCVGVILVNSSSPFLYFQF